MKREFKSESKQLLNLMIHSIYSNKDIFLRELISNASDALDKKEFYKVQSLVKGESESKIRVDIDKDKRTITITDTGVGMNEDDLDKNLGTIAHSGSKEFIEKLENEDASLIGQFGVGFYSAFIVADDVIVETKKENEDGFCFKSDGVDSYEIEKADLKDVGTKIILNIKKGDDFDKYLESYSVENLIKTHSDYVKYPIEMYKEVPSEPSENEESGEEKEEIKIFEYQTVNSQIALWKKKKSEVKKEEYNEFYSSKYFDFTEPLKVIHAKSEGTTNMDMLLYIPAQKSFDYSTPNFKKGLDLYCKGVLIDSNVDYLLPDYFNFVKGLVDSEDLSLNISREMLQQDRVVDKLKKAVNTKIKKELLKIMKKDRENYDKFYNEFGRTLMFGIYENYGQNKEELQDLIMFKTNLSDSYVSLSEYIEKNAEQNEILYISGESVEKINMMPIMEKIKSSNKEVLYLTNDVDEFAIQVLVKYNEKEFKSVLTTDLSSKEEKEEIDKITTENKDVLENIKSGLEGLVDEVRLTTKLENTLACVVNKEDVSIEQEKILSQMPDNKLNLTKVLELNPKHPLFEKLSKASDPKKYSQLIFDQALLIEGLSIEDPKRHAQLLNDLILENLK